jgi:CRP-like cAMP-binding protein
MWVGTRGALPRDRMNHATSLLVTETATRDVSVCPALGVLRSSRWFSGFSATALAQLAANASIHSFSSGQQVVLPARWLGAAMLVVRGCICATRRTDSSRELTLETFRAGDLLVDAPVNADADLACDGLVAAETSALLLFPREEFLGVTRSAPELALAIVRDFELRLSRVKALAWGLATTDVEGRLYRLLVALARDEGEVGAEGTVIARLPTQRDLAGRIGACRETVSRIVADLARQGLLTLRGRRLTLLPGFFALARAADGF